MRSCLYPLGHEDLVVAGITIHKAQHFVTGSCVDQCFHDGHRVLVLWRCFVEVSEIHADLPSAILLLYRDQGSDQDLMKIRQHTGENEAPDFRVDDKGTLWYKDRICVPKRGDLRQIIMDEAHNSTYSIHPGATKMYMDLRQKYWWNGMKADIAQYIGHCDVCPRVKAEHQKLAGLLQTLPIPVWKWDEIGMDFVVGLPKTQT